MTVKTAITSWGSTSNSTTGNQYLFPGGTVSANGTENFRFAEWSEPGTVSDVGIVLSVNASTASFLCVLRKNAADAGVSVSPPALTTGEFTDTTNTATVVAGDNVDVRVSAHTTAAYTMRGVYFHFTPDTSGVAISRFGTVSGASYSTASTTRFGHNQAINSFQTAEALCETRMRHQGTAEYLHTWISANARSTANTVGLRINQADSSMVVSIPASTTGQFNDLTNTPAVDVDDRWAMFHRTGTGTGGITVQFIGFAIRSTGGKQTLSSWGSSSSYSTASGTTYRSLTGHTGQSGGLADVQHTWFRDGIISDYCIRVHANTRSDASTQTLADGSGTDTSITISVPSSTTGLFADTTNTETFSSGAAYVSKLTLGAGTGGIATNTHDTRINPAVSAIDLMVQDATHAHTTDAVALTQTHILAAQDAAHAHNTDAIALTQLHQLVAQDAAHAHTADSPTLSLVYALAVQDALHAHTADSFVLAVTYPLAVQDSAHAHATDAVALTQTHILAAQDAAHGHTADSPAFTQTYVLVVADAMHAHALESLGFTQVHNLVAADALHALLSDNVTVGSGDDLLIADAIHALLSDNVNIQAFGFPPRDVDVEISVPRRAQELLVADPAVALTVGEPGVVGTVDGPTAPWGTVEDPTRSDDPAVTPANLALAVAAPATTLTIAAPTR